MRVWRDHALGSPVLRTLAVSVRCTCRASTRWTPTGVRQAESPSGRARTTPSEARSRLLDPGRRAPRPPIAAGSLSGPRTPRARDATPRGRDPGQRGGQQAPCSRLRSDDAADARRVEALDPGHVVGLERGEAAEAPARFLPPAVPAPRFRPAWRTAAGDRPRARPWPQATQARIFPSAWVQAIRVRTRAALSGWENPAENSVWPSDFPATRRASPLPPEDRPLRRVAPGEWGSPAGSSV